MPFLDQVFRAVHHVTGVTKAKITSRSRRWPIVEARMLVVLLLSRLGYDDLKIALAIERNRTTILKSRHHAEDYLSVSAIFRYKFLKISELYEDSKSI